MVTIDQALSSVQNMQKFFDENQDIAQVQKLSNKQNELSSSCLYYNRWYVCLIFIKGPFIVFGTIFFECTKGVCNVVGAKNLSLRCTIIAEHLEYAITKLCTQCDYGRKMLVPSTNTHQLRTSDFYLHAPVARTSVDSTLKKSMFSHNDHIKFNHFGGVCRGTGLWFLYLYFKTRSSFTDPVAHMRAIGLQFKQGAQRPAAMIQSFLSLEKDLLNMKIQMDFSLISAKNITDIPTSVKQSLENLPSGAYAVWLYKHQIDYFKFDNHTAFIFDPNFGVINISGSDQSQQLYEFLKRYHLQKFDSRDLTFNWIYFHFVSGIG